MKKVVLAVLLLMVAVPAYAEGPELPPTGVKAAVVSTLKDLKTYAPAGVYYTAAKLDWHSSQPLFANGTLEENGHYTLSGLPHSAPVSESVGNHRILVDTLEVAGMSAANNVASNFLTNKLIAKHPEHKKLIGTLGFVERAVFASVLSYSLSAPHFSQWEVNTQFSSRRW